MIVVGLLKHNITLGSGITCADVYYRISQFNGDKINIIYTVDAYASKAAFDAGKPILFRKNYAFPTPTDADLIKQGYTNLKLTDDFKDATDVLES
nr:MAG TPA: hypothetical protein [Caudoviricetes sp.]